MQSSVLIDDMVMTDVCVAKHESCWGKLFIYSYNLKQYFWIYIYIVEPPQVTPPTPDALIPTIMTVIFANSQPQE